MKRDEFNAIPGSITAPETARLERLLRGPIERVWAYLVEPEKRRTWLAGGAFELRQNGRTELRFDHSEITSEEPPERYRKFDGGHILVGRILAIEPPRLLTYTWPEGERESEVTFELAERGEEILLTITHRRLGGARTMISVASGWDAHTGILIDLLDSRPARGFWSVIDRFETLYGERFAAD